MAPDGFLQTSPEAQGAAVADMPAWREPHVWVCTALTLALTALALLPILAVDLLPLLDAPQQLHMATVLADWGENPLWSQAYARVSGPVPTSLPYALVAVLARLWGAEIAVRVAFAVGLAALPWAALALLRTVGHNRWLLLGILPWLLNAEFFAGQLALCLAMPLFLLLLAAHLRWLRRPIGRRLVPLLGLQGALALTHPVPLVVAVCLLPLLSGVLGARQGRWRGPLWLLRDLALWLPALGLLLPWGLREVAPALQGTALGRAYGAEPILPLDNLRQIADRLFDWFAPHGAAFENFGDLLLRRPGEIASGLWGLGFCLWALGAVRHWRADRGVGIIKTIDESPPGGTKAFAVDGTSYAGWALALVTVAYFLLPQHLIRPFALYGVNFRILPLLGILAVVALPLHPLQPPRTARIRVWLGSLAMLLAAVVLPLATLEAFLVARAELGPVREAYAAAAPWQSCLTLRSKRASGALRLHVFYDVGRYYAVFQGGQVPHALGDEAILPLRIRPTQARPTPHGDDHDAFSWQEHGRYYDYIAVFKDVNDPPQPFEAPLAALPRLYQRGSWQVFQSLDVQPWPPPPPPPPSLGPTEQGTAQSLLECTWARMGLQLGAGLRDVPVDPATLDPFGCLGWHEARQQVDLQRDRAQLQRDLPFDAWRDGPGVRSLPTWLLPGPSDVLHWQEPVQ